MSKFEFIAGGGSTVKVDQGGDIGIITVSGTPMIRHDLPEYDEWRAGAGNDPAVIGAEREARIEAGETSWCSYKGHVGDERELPVEMFDIDNTRLSGRHPYCKTCRSVIRRAGYEKDAESEGRTVRPYRRQPRHTNMSS